MRGGDYDASFTLLEKAVSLAGEDSRRGGEFKLWAVQALQGVGRNKQSVKLLESLKAHRDLDVRKVGGMYTDLSDGRQAGRRLSPVESTRTVDGFDCSEHDAKKNKQKKCSSFVLKANC